MILPLFKFQMCAYELILMNYMHLLTFNGIHLVIFCFLVLLYSTGLVS